MRSHVQLSSFAACPYMLRRLRNCETG